MNDYYTREEIVKDDYIFISYKHTDRDKGVQAALDYFYDQGIRFWYDKDLGAGDKWIDVAGELINHDKCRGVVFFNSVDSFTSEPIFNERKIVIEKIEAYAKKDKKFFVYPINIGHPSTMTILKAIFDMLPSTDKEMERIFPLKYLEGISKLFCSETIYCYADPEDPTGYLDGLCKKMAQDMPSVLDKKTLEMKKLKNSGASGNSSITIGIRKDVATGKLPLPLLQSNKRVTYNQEVFLVQNGQAYTVKDITWRVLYCDDKDFVLIADDTVDLRNGGKELQDYLSTEFKDNAFTDSEKSIIGSVRLLCRDDISMISDSNQLVFPPSVVSPEGHWWIDAVAHGALQMVIKKDGSLFRAGYNVRTKKSGVRPVITIGKDDLLEYQTKNNKII